VTNATLHYFKDKSWMFILRFLGGAAACVLIIFGLIGVVTLGGFNPKTLVDDFYQMLFGALIICAEMRWVRFLKQFSFLTSFLGLGLFYIFVGGLALDSGIAMIVMAVIFWALGLVYVGLFCMRRNYSDPNAAPGSANSTQTVDLEAPPAPDSFETKVAKHMIKGAVASKASSFKEFVDEDERGSQQTPGQAEPR